MDDINDDVRGHYEADISDGDALLDKIAHMIDGGAIVGGRMAEMVGNFVRNLKEGRARLVIGMGGKAAA